MTLEEIKTFVLKPKEFDWNGRKVWLRKLGAKDGLELFDKIKATPEGTTDDKRLTLEFHVNIISRSLANEQGELLADSDQGRETLMQFGFDDLVSLGDLVLDHSGYGQKKT